MLGVCSHPCPLLDYLKRRQSDHICHHPHRFNELATKTENWNRKPRLERANGRHTPSKTPVGDFPGHIGVKENDRTGRLAGKASITRNVEELETRPAGTKPGTRHHRSPGGGRRGERKRSTIFLKRMKECHRQSGEHWNCFKGNIGETFERRGGAHMDFFERLNTILN